jgi:thioredoxin-related protein
MKYILIYISLFLVIVLSAGPISRINAQTRTSSLYWYSWDDGVSAARRGGKKIIIDVYTNYCGWCKKMDKESYGNPTIQGLLNEDFIPIKLDAESRALVTFGDDQLTEAEVAKRFGVDGYPTTLVFDEQLKLIRTESGYIEPKIFYYFLKYYSTDSYKRMSFENFISSVGRPGE